MKIVLSIIVGVIFCTVISPLSFASDVGKRFPSEKRTFIDKVTGLTITALTTSPANDQLPYQTHPHWTSDGKYVIFHSDRASDGSNQAFAFCEETGEIIQLTEGATRTNGLNVARKSNLLYFLRGAINGPKELIELKLDPLLADSKAGTMKSPDAYERVIMTMPENLKDSGGFVLDADESAAYIGVSFVSPADLQNEEQVATGAQKDSLSTKTTRRYGIRGIDLKTGELKKIIDVPFRIGHVQVNPFVPGEILYCHETGGDAPQRMWIVKADGTGNRPLYIETPDEWITHEVWIDKDHVMFNIMAHLPALREKPTGIAIINVRSNEMRIIGQTDEILGFWHCNGTADGRWAMGDTFEGNIYLIDRHNYENFLLTTDHKMKPDHTHPFFSPDGKRILFQSGLLSNGKNLNLMTVDIPNSWLNRRYTKGTP
jgi:oligogalacturonide lyase